MHRMWSSVWSCHVILGALFTSFQSPRPFHLLLGLSGSLSVRALHRTPVPLLTVSLLMNATLQGYLCDWPYAHCSWPPLFVARIAPK